MSRVVENMVIILYLKKSLKEQKQSFWIHPVGNKLHDKKEEWCDCLLWIIQLPWEMNRLPVFQPKFTLAPSQHTDINPVVCLSAGTNSVNTDTMHLTREAAFPPPKSAVWAHFNINSVGWPRICYEQDKICKNKWLEQAAPYYKIISVYIYTTVIVDSSISPPWISPHWGFTVIDSTNEQTRADPCETL